MRMARCGSTKTALKIMTTGGMTLDLNANISKKSPYRSTSKTVFGKSKNEKVSTVNRYHDVFVSVRR